MMRVRMKVGISGGRGDGTDWPNVGGKITVPDAEGKDLCTAGMAEQVDDEPVKVEPEPMPEKPELKVETATVDDTSETSTPLTTTDGPVKRGPGRPRKNA